MSVFARDQPFRLLEDGSVVVSLRDEEAELLARLPQELKPLYEGGGADKAAEPVRRRLFPRAYLDPTEDRAEQEWQSLVAPDLLRRRLDALATVTASLDGGEHRRGRVVLTLAPDAVQEWLGVLNDARLALGVRLEITEDTDYTDVDPNAPNAFAFAAYAWLSAVQGELIEVLLVTFDGLEPGDDLRD